MYKIMTNFKMAVPKISVLSLSAIIILASLLQIQGNPLVYPNKFSFQKSTTTSTTPEPLHNNSIVAESDLPKSSGRSIRNDIAWVIGIGAVLLVCVLIAILYTRAKRRNGHHHGVSAALSSSSCSMLPGNEYPKLEVVPASINN